MALRVSSPAFSNGAEIPKKYTCDGQNVAPPLEWSGVPEQSKSVALICDDPDAPRGTFSHWVVVNLQPSVKALKEGVPAETVVPAAATETAGHQAISCQLSAIGSELRTKADS